MTGRNDSTKAAKITQRQKNNGKEEGNKMLSAQLVALLFIAINIKCVVSVRTDTFGSRSGIQHKNNDFLHGGDRNQGRRREVPTFVNVTYKNSLKLPSRCIFDRLRNPFKCLSPLRGSFQSVQVSRKERKGETSPLEDLSITHGSSVAVLQEEAKNVVRKKRDILSSGFKHRTQGSDMMDAGSDPLRRGSKNQIKHDRGAEIGQAESPKREKSETKEMSQTHGGVRSLVGTNRGPHRKKGTPQGVVDIQNTNVRSFLQGGEENRSLHLLNYIYHSWKEKNFANFVTAIKDKGFNHTCVEKWLHKMSISINKKYIKIQLRRDYVLIKNKYFDPRQTRVKEFHLTYGDINKCLEILIKDMDKFCSYEMSSILWAITIILIKLFKGSNSVDSSMGSNVDNTGSVPFSEIHAVTTTLLHNFRKFFSLIVLHLNKVKGYLSIDESLWAIWSLCKLLHFNVLCAGGASSAVGSDGSDFSVGDSSPGGSLRGDGVREEAPYSPHQVAYLKNKFHLTEETVKHILDIFNHIYKHLHGNLQFLQEKYYIYIPFIIFESQTLLLRSSVLLLNRIMSIILKRDILLSLFNFDTLKRKLRRRTLQMRHGRSIPETQHGRSTALVSIPHRKNSYSQNVDIFRIKTLSKVYKLIKCISKIFYPLKNPNIRNLNLHNNYDSLDVGLLGDFVRACNDVLVKYVDYFVFVIRRDEGERSVQEGGATGSDAAVEGGEEPLLPLQERLRMEHKNELIFIYNCLRSSLVSLIKLDLKDKYMYEWLNGNMHLFQFGRLVEAAQKSGGAEMGNAPSSSLFRGNASVGNASVGDDSFSNAAVANTPIGNLLGDRYTDHFQSEELLREGPPLVDSSTFEQTNSAHPSYGEREIADGEPQIGDANCDGVSGGREEVTPLGTAQSIHTHTDNRETSEGPPADGIATSDGKGKSNDVCLDVLALSKFTKLYSTEMKRKLIANVKRSIADSLKQFENLYQSSNTDQVHHPTYVCINDIYIIKEKRIEELYDEETKTFYKKKKSVNFRNVIMPKQLAIYVNYIGRNMNLVESKKELDEIFCLSVRYINTTRFNYFTSNDIIHFLQGLLNYYEVERKGMNALSEQVNRMLILLCSIVENSFLKWKSSNICQLIYLLTKYKHIHRNIFNKFDWLLNRIEFPRYVYERAGIDTAGGGEVGSDENVVGSRAVQLDSSDGDAAQLDSSYRDAPMDSSDGDATQLDSPGNRYARIHSSDSNAAQSDYQDNTDMLCNPPARHTERTSKSTRISINEIKYDNLGSALWAMTSLNKHVIKKKFFLKFCYLFSVYFSLHMKLYLSQKHRDGCHSNGFATSTEQDVKEESQNDDDFLRHHATYFKLPLDSMTISIYVNTFARKIKIGFKHLFDVIKNDVTIVSNFSVKELSYIMYSLANVDSSALGDSVFHDEPVCHDGGDVREESRRRLEQFLHRRSALWVDDVDDMFDAVQGLPPKEIRSQEEEPTSKEAHQVGGNGSEDSNESSNGNGNDPVKRRSKTIVRKKSFLKFKRDRIEISSEFLNSLMQKVYNCASAILQKKKKYLQEAISDGTLYMSNANKKKKIEIIDLMKLVYSIFVFLNQRIQVGRDDGIKFGLAEEIIRLYSLIVKSFPSTLNYIYVIIDTYALISNVYTLDAFTRGIIKEFVQICVKKVEEEKMLDLEKKKIMMSIQNLKATN
ncbi:hypothetical protein C922_04036 [Plasmodium inui San Antonio 1]|uniref:Uncharacterized protein n=1 Tax=Plasmodium inui San Antonio 1 TaxID=1237626 RepID=W7A1J1_9APIC|nr:hypothetical protein C922_04036 [Plasmodium inui San Antonio 1]EUD65530.1 hypothetical protein C922_04036 [Plasmodium inui San Antonio 1]